MYFKPEGDKFNVECRRCGNYAVSRTVVGQLKNLSERQIGNISGWLRENPNYFISSDNLEFLKSIPTPSFHTRSEKLLSNLETLTTFAGESLEVKDNWLSMSWCMNSPEIWEIINYLKSSKYIVDAGSTSEHTRLKIAPAGWAYLDSLKKSNQQSQQGFVAMWFDEKMQQVYDSAIAVGIVKAGYLPHRVDLREHNDKIDDEIIAQIRRSRFVVADFTGHRGGVYYEAGFAKGLGLEVIWSCRESDLKKLHFDIRQYNCIVWQQGKLDDFAERIQNRIEAVLGEGPNKYLGGTND
jgi:nucleoside 2-deoxyribosyltransferase